MMGRDFRPYSSEPDSHNQRDGKDFGMPKFISVPQKVSKVSLGRNHILMVSDTGDLFSLGSNQYGQLGINDSELQSFYDHPINLSKLYYSQQPIQVPFFVDLKKKKFEKKIIKNKETSPVVQIACGDEFSLALTQSGKLYSWGLMDDGRLGIRAARGKSYSTSKNSYTDEPQLVKFTDDHIEEIQASGSMAYARVSGQNDLTKQGLSEYHQKLGLQNRIYVWGSIQKGVQMNRQALVHQVPHYFSDLQPY